MALIRVREGPGYTTTSPKLPTCFTCKEKKSGLFTRDANGSPQCADCAANQGKPLPGYADMLVPKNFDEIRD